MCIEHVNMVDTYSRVWSGHRAKRGLTLPQVGDHTDVRAAFNMIIFVCLLSRFSAYFCCLFLRYVTSTHASLPVSSWVKRHEQMALTAITRCITVLKMPFLIDGLRSECDRVKFVDLLSL